MVGRQWAKFPTRSEREVNSNRGDQERSSSLTMLEPVALAKDVLLVIPRIRSRSEMFSPLLRRKTEKRRETISYGRKTHS